MRHVLVCLGEVPRLSLEKQVRLRSAVGHRHLESALFATNETVAQQTARQDAAAKQAARYD